MTDYLISNETCEVCGKKLFNRDVAYSKWKLGKVVCAAHSQDPLLTKEPSNQAEQQKFLEENSVNDLPF